MKSVAPTWQNPMEMPAKFVIVIQCHPVVKCCQMLAEFHDGRRGRKLDEFRLMAMQPGNRTLPQANDYAQPHDDPANRIRTGRFFVAEHVIGPDAADVEHDQRLLVVVLVLIVKVIIIPVETTYVHPIIRTDSHFLSKLRELKIPLKQCIWGMNFDFFDL